MNLLLREDSGRRSEYRLNPRPCSGPTHDTTDRDSFWPVAPWLRSPILLNWTEAKRELIQLTEDVVEDFRLAGHAYYANYEFDQALAAYQEGLRYVSKQAMPTLWATLMIDIANTQRYIAVRSEEESLHQHFRAAAVALRDACTVYSKKDFPELWAKIQNNLGNALQENGERTNGPEGANLLREADEAYRKAKSVSTTQTPYETARWLDVATSPALPIAALRIHRRSLPGR